MFLDDYWIKLTTPYKQVSGKTDDSVDNSNSICDDSNGSLNVGGNGIDSVV